MRTFRNPRLPGNQDERIREIMDKIEPCLVGYQRVDILLALTRTTAAMLGPADAVERRVAVEAIPRIIEGMLQEMDGLFQ